ncbi:hypothetical protein PAPYR_5867 [Paratrimastix pyriformis]|uniref:Uncharacterized protein n=1 Tax=Paratrimastix pyriformis TaxID=342808 RepID=A0ABQ8UGU5_9EUKA|nr:hypothetical protein PAPYR_5867 [Paratrimastix pyriformis]
MQPSDFLQFTRQHSLLPDPGSSQKSQLSKYVFQRSGKATPFTLEQIPSFPDYTRLVGIEKYCVIQARVESVQSQRATFVDLLELPHETGGKKSAMSFVRRRFLYYDDHPLNIISASLNESRTFLSLTTCHCVLVGGDDHRGTNTLKQFFSRPKPAQGSSAPEWKIQYETILIQLDPAVIPGRPPRGNPTLSSIASLQTSFDLLQLHFLPDPGDTALKDQRLWAIFYEEHHALNLVRLTIGWDEKGSLQVHQKLTALCGRDEVPLWMQFDAADSRLYFIDRRVSSIPPGAAATAPGPGPLAGPVALTPSNSATPTPPPMGAVSIPRVDSFMLTGISSSDLSQPTFHCRQFELPGQGPQRYHSLYDTSLKIYVPPVPPGGAVHLRVPGGGVDIAGAAHSGIGVGYIPGGQGPDALARYVNRTGGWYPLTGTANPNLHLRVVRMRGAPAPSNTPAAPSSSKPLQPTSAVVPATPPGAPSQPQAAATAPTVKRLAPRAPRFDNVTTASPRVLFTTYGDMLLVYLPGRCLHMVDCGPEHEPMDGLHLSGSQLVPFLDMLSVAPLPSTGSAGGLGSIPVGPMNIPLLSMDHWFPLLTEFRVPEGLAALDGPFWAEPGMPEGVVMPFFQRPDTSNHLFIDHNTQCVVEFKLDMSALLGVLFPARPLPTEGTLSQAIATAFNAMSSTTRHDPAGSPMSLPALSPGGDPPSPAITVVASTPPTPSAAAPVGAPASGRRPPPDAFLMRRAQVPTPPALLRMQQQWIHMAVTHMQMDLAPALVAHCVSSCPFALSAEVIKEMLLAAPYHQLKSSVDSREDYQRLQLVPLTELPPLHRDPEARVQFLVRCRSLGKAIGGGLAGVGSTVPEPPPTPLPQPLLTQLAQWQRSLMAQAQIQEIIEVLQGTAPQPPLRLGTLAPRLALATVHALARPQLGASHRPALRPAEALRRALLDHIQIVLRRPMAEDATTAFCFQYRNGAVTDLCCLVEDAVRGLRGAAPAGSTDPLPERVVNLIFISLLLALLAAAEWCCLELTDQMRENLYAVARRELPAPLFLQLVRRSLVTVNPQWLLEDLASLGSPLGGGGAAAAPPAGVTSTPSTSGNYLVRPEDALQQERLAVDMRLVQWYATQRRGAPDDNPVRYLQYRSPLDASLVAQEYQRAMHASVMLGESLEAASPGSLAGPVMASARVLESLVRHNRQRQEAARDAAEQSAAPSSSGADDKSLYPPTVCEAVRRAPFVSQARFMRTVLEHYSTMLTGPTLRPRLATDARLHALPTEDATGGFAPLAEFTDRLRDGRAASSEERIAQQALLEHAHILLKLEPVP